MILIVSVHVLRLRRYFRLMTTIQEQFGARVRDLRKKRGWTQEQLGEVAGRHWTYIGGIERGERNVTLQVVADIARALDVEIGDLFRELGTTRRKR
jgi:transcriptional regulator with XRE-family HTH domain